MNVRIYFPFAPYPVTEGAYLIVADQMRYFMTRGHGVQLVCWRESKDAFESKRARSGLIGGADWMLLRAGREGSASRVGRVAGSIFSRFASPELYLYPPSLLEELGTLGPTDLAIYHYSYAYSWLCRPEKLPREKRRAVHLHNIESDGHLLRGGGFHWIHRINARKLRRHELALERLVDEPWFLSQRDAQMLEFSRFRIVPPTFNSSLRASRTPGSADEVVVGFIGAMNFGPNYESVRWLLREVAPRLELEGFSGRLLIAGKSPPPDLRRLGSRYSFVEFCGFVENIEDFWAQLSFLAVPHIVGSGVRTKMLEGVASGVPVLTNEAGLSLLPEGVRRSPYLWCSDDPGLWVERLLAERSSYRTRNMLAVVPACEALTAEVVYADVA